MRLSFPAARAVVVVFAASLAVLFVPRPIHAQLEDEVATRVITYASLTSDGSAVITSSSHAYPYVPDDDDITSDDRTCSVTRACNVGARSSSDGAVLWTGNACSSDRSKVSSSAVRHAVYASPSAKRAYTLDDAGTFRGWDELTGTMTFDVGLTSRGGGFVPAEGTPRLFGLDFSDSALALIGAAVATKKKGGTKDEVLLLRSGETGKAVAGDAEIRAADALSEAGVGSPKSGSVAKILGLVPIEGEAKASVLLGWVYAAEEGKSIASGGTMAFVDVEVSSTSDGEEPSCKVGSARPVKVGGDSKALGRQPLKASTMRVFSLGGKTHIMAVASGVEGVVTVTAEHGGDSSAAVAATATKRELKDFHPLWKSLISVHPHVASTDGGNEAVHGNSKVGGGNHYVRVTGEDDGNGGKRAVRRSIALFHFNPSTGKIGKQVYQGPTYGTGKEETQDDAMVQCADLKLSFEYDRKKKTTSIKAYRTMREMILRGLKVSGDAETSLPKGDPLRADDTHLLSCTSASATILATTESGTSLFLSASFEKSGVVLNSKWSAKEEVEEGPLTCDNEETDAAGPIDEEEVNGEHEGSAAAAGGLRQWLRDLDASGSNTGRFEAYAPAFEKHFDSLEDVALAADYAPDGLEAIFRECGVENLGDKGRISRAISKLPRPE